MSKIGAPTGFRGPYGGGWRQGNETRTRHINSSSPQSPGRRLTPEELKAAAAQMELPVSLDRYAKTDIGKMALAFQKAKKDEEQIKKSPKRFRGWHKSPRRRGGD